jgi:predicted permease
VAKLSGFLRGRGCDGEFDDEIQEHLQLLAERFVAQGMSKEEAVAAARRQFGNTTLLEDDRRELQTLPSIEALWHDLRYALRTLRKSPGFTLVAVLVMALGIGATTALFTVVRSVLLKPLPFKEPDRLIRLYEHSSDDRFPYNVVAGGMFAEWRKQSHGFSDMAIDGQDYREYGLSGAGGQLPEKVRGGECSWNLFPMLGVGPALGRSFTAADDQPSANGTVVLSWGLWKRRFGGDPAILNRTIHLDAKPYTVIGVMPSWFAYPEQAIQLWMPLYHEERPELMQALDDHEFHPIGRLKPGATEAQATAELSVITRRIHDQHLDIPFVSKAASSRPLLEAMVGDTQTALYVLLAATFCVLLIACLNVASLLVARGAARRKELAIRAALGGGRWRLLGEHLTETFVLSLAGGALGLMVAYGLIQWFVATRQDMTRVEAIHIDGVVAAFGAGLVLFCTFFAGVTSALSSKSDQVLSSLQESSRSHSTGQARVRLRKGLLSAEVGLTVLLLIGSGLLLKSYKQLRSTRLGCITENVLTMHIDLPEVKYREPAQRMEFFETLLGRVRALPGVRAAGLTTTVPGEGYGGDNGFLVAEHPPIPLDKTPYAIHRWVDPGYFAALGIPFLRGQTFDENQRLDRVNETIISESFARQYFPVEDPLGKHLLTLGQKPYKIVGVVGDTRHDILERPQPIMYFPFYSGQSTGATLAIRSASDVTALALPVQRIVQQLDSELPVSDVLTMDQIIGKSTLDASFEAALLVAFALLSLLLASVGLFGVLSYIVAQRTPEIGIRLALGAQRSELLRLTLIDGLKPAGVGLIIGLAGAAGATRLISSLLYGVQPLDASVFAIVAVVLAAVAAAACLLPAWRASRVDPIVALRYE